MSKIKFIKSLEKVSDDVWLYTPGALVMADGTLNEHRKWIKFIRNANIWPSGELQDIWVVYQSNPLTDPPSSNGPMKKGHLNLYEACTKILKWFWDLSDYQNDPERLSRLDEDRAKGIGPVPELVINFKSTDVYQAAEQQAKAKELSQ